MVEAAALLVDRWKRLEHPFGAALNEAFRARPHRAARAAEQTASNAAYAARTAAALAVRAEGEVVARVARSEAERASGRATRDRERAGAALEKIRQGNFDGEPTPLRTLLRALVLDFRDFESALQRPLQHRIEKMIEGDLESGHYMGNHRFALSSRQAAAQTRLKAKAWRQDS